ncbi:YvrJ family protein [Niallia sp. Krafla_26]|uniref:YvrJ family protein n=1 Tax=Niallia sp. Krafla_26 TaxID=3064703 RepID=UPI003D177ED5
MNITDISTWTSILGNFGFPVLVSLYLLLKFEAKIEKLTEVIEKLIETEGNKK